MRFYIFLNVFFVDDALKNAINALKRDDHVLLFTYAPGFIRSANRKLTVGSAVQYDVSGIEALIEMPMHEYSRRNPVNLGGGRSWGDHQNQPFPFGTVIDFIPNLPGCEGLEGITYPNDLSGEEMPCCISPVFKPVDPRPNNVYTFGVIDWEKISDKLAAYDLTPADMPTVPTLVGKKHSKTDGGEMRQYYTVYSLAPMLPAKILRAFAQLARVHIYTFNENDSIYANGKFVGFHTGEVGEKDFYLRVPADATGYKLYQGEFADTNVIALPPGAAGHTMHLNYTLPAGQTYLVEFLSASGSLGLESQERYPGPTVQLTHLEDQCNVTLYGTTQAGVDTACNTGDLYMRLVIDGNESQPNYIAWDSEEERFEILPYPEKQPAIAHYQVADMDNVPLVTLKKRGLVSGTHHYKIDTFVMAEEDSEFIMSSRPYEDVFEADITGGAEPAAVTLHANPQHVASHETITFTYDTRQGSYCNELVDAYVRIRTPLGTEMWLEPNGEMAPPEEREPVGTFYLT
ncbi:MAG: hypothetical protein P8123_09615, partial [bacterium]